MLPIKFLTIHCSASPDGRNDSPEDIERWDIKRFGQKSYHLVIPRDGRIHRSLPDNVRGAHTAKANTGNIGVCYVGGMDAGMLRPKDTRTAMQRSALLRVVQDYRAKYPGIIVRGHNEWPGVAKACPSFSVRSWLKAEGII